MYIYIYVYLYYVYSMYIWYPSSDIQLELYLLLLAVYTSLERVVCSKQCPQLRPLEESCSYRRIAWNARERRPVLNTCKDSLCNQSSSVQLYVEAFNIVTILNHSILLQLKCCYDNIG